jgi:conserved oligomeric Golgi complex subunit 2
MRKNEELLRRLKKGKKSAFSLFSSASSVASSDEPVDEDRVRAQVLLDVDALGKDAASIGVKVEESINYKALQSLAQSQYEDGS